jgi:predicted alpha-1,6-mannanase (GH76 family)
VTNSEYYSARWLAKTPAEQDRVLSDVRAYMARTFGGVSVLDLVNDEARAFEAERAARTRQIQVDRAATCPTRWHLIDQPDHEANVRAQGGRG